MQIRFLIDVVPGAGVRFEAGMSYDLDASVAQRYLADGSAVRNAESDGGTSSGGSAAEFYTQATRPAASADNLGNTIVVVDDNGGRLYVSNGTSWVPAAASVGEGSSAVLAVGASRALTAADNGATLEVTAGGLTITVPISLPVPFRVHLMLNTGTTSFDPTGSTQINGGTATLTRAASGNPLITLQSRVSAANSYTLSGS